MCDPRGPTLPRAPRLVQSSDVVVLKFLIILNKRPANYVARPCHWLRLSVGAPGMALPTPCLPGALHAPQLPARPPAPGWPRPPSCGRLWFPGAHSAAAVFEDALERCPQTVFLLSPSLRSPLPAPTPWLLACCRPGRKRLGREALDSSSAPGPEPMCGQRQLRPKGHQPQALSTSFASAGNWGLRRFPSSFVGRIPGDTRGGSLAQGGCGESISFGPLVSQAFTECLLRAEGSPCRGSSGPPCGGAGWPEADL